ncbi:MAG: phenylalanine 4-monooxygenase [Coxiellaceae bacterium]|nr:phenylalanine 4-monooxygenase [Coxiellaceae bacterium]
MSLKPEQPKYISKKPDQYGYVEYTAEENETWKILYERQMQAIKDRACDEFISGVHALAMNSDGIPQIPEINKHLKKATGWSVAAVPSLISSERFFELLANKQFPAATFIRTREELDYLQEPDIFHEIFGHCPLLTNKNYADFVEAYGKLSLKVTPKEQNKLLRLFWLTIEFGLLETRDGLRIYGGGILSSYEETLYSLESGVPKRLAMNILDALRTPYRIDIKQPIYYYISSLDTLYDILQTDLMSLVHEAIKLGDFEPEFTKD